MNTLIGYLFLLQMIFCFLSSLYSISWFNSYSRRLDYLYLGLSSSEQSSYTFLLFSNWGTWILNFTNLIPISLIVTLEMVKYG